MLNYPECFSITQLDESKRLGHHHLPLDEPRDVVFLQSVFERLQRLDGLPFLTQDLLDVLEGEPALLQANGGLINSSATVRGTV